MKAFIIRTLRHILLLRYSNQREFVRHTARVGEIINAYNILVGKPKGRRPLGRGIPSSGGIL
jgi:hypothetical protein